MGGVGSGRKPDPVKKFLGFNQPAKTDNSDVFLPNYSGVKRGAQKVDGTPDIPQVYVPYVGAFKTIQLDAANFLADEALVKLTGKAGNTSNFLEAKDPLGNEKFIIDNLGQVGVNEATPEANFHVSGSQIIETTATEALLVRKASDGGDIFSIDTNLGALYSKDNIQWVFGDGFDGTIRSDGTDFKFFSLADMKFDPVGDFDVTTIAGNVNINAGALNLDAKQVIDETSTEAFLVRKDGDTGDVLTVDTSNSIMTMNGRSVVNQGTVANPLTLTVGATCTGQTSAIPNLLSATFVDARTTQNISNQCLRFSYVRNAGATATALAWDGAIVLPAIFNESSTAPYRAITMEGPTVASGKTMASYTGIQMDGSGGTGTITTRKGINIDDSVCTLGTQYGIFMGDLDQATTNYSLYLGTAQNRIGGDLYFEGEDSGVPFGEIYAYNNATTMTISGTGIANKVQITSFNNNGLSNRSTPDHTNDHITVTTAGKYMCVVSLTGESVAGLGFTAGFGVFKNNGATQFQNLHAHRDFSGGGGDIGSVSMSGIIDCAANDTIEVWCWNETNTNNIDVDDITLSIHQLGGT